MANKKATAVKKVNPKQPRTFGNNKKPLNKKSSVKPKKGTPSKASLIAQQKKKAAPRITIKTTPSIAITASAG